MSPEAGKVAQTLLDHHRKVCRSQSRASPSVEACLIVYENLCEQSGLSHLKPNVGKLLCEIAQWCHDNGWPPLNSLAVNYETRKPGRGYDSAPGCSRAHWLEEVRACINFGGYPDSLS